MGSKFKLSSSTSKGTTAEFPALRSSHNRPWFHHDLSLNFKNNETGKNTGEDTNKLELAPRQQRIRLLALGQMCKGDHTKAYG